MIMKNTLFVMVVLLAVTLVSCDGNPFIPFPCSDEYVYGLEIRLVDKETGGPTGLGAWATIVDGDYEKVSLCEDFGPLGVATLTAGEREGFYDITIDAAGYKQWKRNRVLVSRNRCHVITTKITAELEREESESERTPN